MIRKHTVNITAGNVTIMDFRKAFDKLQHRRLNYKLDWYNGIKGTRARVVGDWVTSDSERIVSAVPWGVYVDAGRGRCQTPCNSI